MYIKYAQLVVYQSYLIKVVYKTNKYNYGQRIEYGYVNKLYGPEKAQKIEK